MLATLAYATSHSWPTGWTGWIKNAGSQERSTYEWGMAMSAALHLPLSPRSSSRCCITSVAGRHFWLIGLGTVFGPGSQEQQVRVGVAHPRRLRPLPSNMPTEAAAAQAIAIQHGAGNRRRQQTVYGPRRQPTFRKSRGYPPCSLWRCREVGFLGLVSRAPVAWPIAWCYRRAFGRVSYNPRGRAGRASGRGTATLFACRKATTIPASSPSRSQ